MILSILATVAVLAAIAVIAAALVFAETTLVYVALGLGGASVLLLIGAILQGRSSESSTDREAGTDGLGKSSVPLTAADVVATVPAPHVQPEKTWRAPAPASEPVREVAVSGAVRAETAMEDSEPGVSEFDEPRWQSPAAADPGSPGTGALGSAVADPGTSPHWERSWESPATEEWRQEAPSDDPQSHGEHEEYEEPGDREELEEPEGSIVSGISAFDTPEVPFAASIPGTAGAVEPGEVHDSEEPHEGTAEFDVPAVTQVTEFTDSDGAGEADVPEPVETAETVAWDSEGAEDVPGAVSGDEDRGESEADTDDVEGSAGSADSVDDSADAEGVDDTEAPDAPGGTEEVDGVAEADEADEIAVSEDGGDAEGVSEVDGFSEGDPEVPDAPGGTEDVVEVAEADQTGEVAELDEVDEPAEATALTEPAGTAGIDDASDLEGSSEGDLDATDALTRPGWVGSMPVEEVPVTEGTRGADGTEVAFGAEDADADTASGTAEGAIDDPDDVEESSTAR